MHKHFFAHVDILPQNVHILNGNADDLLEECKSYEAKIVAAGGIDLFLGGIGTDGHVAFNEPGSSLVSRTRIKTLTYETVVANSRFFGGSVEEVPKCALTVGVGTVMDVSVFPSGRGVRTDFSSGQRSSYYRNWVGQGAGVKEVCRGWDQPYVDSVLFAESPLRDVCGG